MSRIFLAVVGIGIVLGISADPAAAQAPGGGRLREVLPSDGLVDPGLVPFRDQASLNGHYYLADESVLKLDGKAEAVFARYRAGGGEALVLAVAYPTEEAAADVYGRFGRDFFPGFDPKSGRVLEVLESGDAAGAARVRSLLIVVLEAPDRKSCDALLRRIEEKALALYFSRDTERP